jgi:CelD/BcsL family acetyltransferase involved in cellulose biosynthesis
MTAPDRFEIVDPKRAFGPEADAWREMLGASAVDNPFLTPEWLGAWWSAYQRGRRPAIVFARRGRTLAGIFPLQIAHERYRGRIPLRALRLFGDGTYDSDYLDFIIPRGDEAEVVPAFWKWLRHGVGPLRYDVANWNEVSTSSPNYTIVRDLGATSGALVAEDLVGCVVTPLPESWDGYLASLKPRMRTKVRSLRRDLEAVHQVAVVRCEAEEELSESLESLFHLHELRWARRDEPGVFRAPEKRAFYHVAAAALQRRDWLDLHGLSVDGIWVARQICIRYRGTAYLLQEGYDPDWEEQGVGNVLRAMVLERLIAEGVRSYDFLGGVSSHKLSWGGDVTYSARLTLRGRTTRAGLAAGLARLAALTAPLRAALRRHPARGRA